MSGTSSGSSGGGVMLRSSSSEEDLQQQTTTTTDLRKRKRMLSNRESARRSRMRKQQHLDDLLGQVNQLRKENNQILTDINIANQHYLNIEAENSVLRAQLSELSHRLQSLNEIIEFINPINTDHHQMSGGADDCYDQMMRGGGNDDDWLMMINPVMDSLYMMNQPMIMASLSSADMAMY